MMHTTLDQLIDTQVLPRPLAETLVHALRWQACHMLIIGPLSSPQTQLLYALTHALVNTHQPVHVLTDLQGDLAPPVTAPINWNPPHDPLLSGWELYQHQPMACT